MRETQLRPDRKDDPKSGLSTHCNPEQNRAMKKKLLLAGLIGLVLVVVGLFVLGYFLGDVVKKGVETFAPPITQSAS